MGRFLQRKNNLDSINKHTSKTLNKPNHQEKKSVSLMINLILESICLFRLKEFSLIQNERKAFTLKSLTKALVKNHCCV